MPSFEFKESYIREMTNKDGVTFNVTLSKKLIEKLLTKTGKSLDEIFMYGLLYGSSFKGMVLSLEAKPNIWELIAEEIGKTTKGKKTKLVDIDEDDVA